MAIHKFAVGENVRFQATSLTREQNGIYKILALLPHERGEDFKYRLRSAVDSHQRVAQEASLSRS